MKSIALAIGCLLAFAAPLATAETLLIDRVAMEQGKVLPARGSSMAEVEKRFGAPQQKLAPVGSGTRSNPRITRWVYGSVVVYFENTHVVDVVLNKASANEIGPAPAQP